MFPSHDQHRLNNKVWNEWFRDQNLQDSLVVDIDDGPDTLTDYVLNKRNKRSDYFTSCLPFLQKGDTVEISIGGEAPITGFGKQNQNYPNSTTSVYETDGTGTVSYASSSTVSSSTVFDVEEDPNNAGYPNIRADLSNVTAITINSLRQAEQIQEMLELDARSGTRYVENVKAHWGVTSPDGRQQRTEYLGGGSSPVLFSPIARTDSSPGELGAMAQATFKGHGFSKSFTEHSVVIGFVNVRADLTYQEGINRMFTDQTRYDLYDPMYACLGEQAVLNKEIYVDATTIGAGTDVDVFGYQEAWSHLRFKNSMITGKFRSNDPASLDAWHLGVEFGGQPTLDDTFITENPPMRS